MTANAAPAHVPEHLVFPFDLYNDPRLRDDLFAGFAKITAGKPDVFFTPDNGGHWVVTRLAVAEEILRDYAHFSVREMEVPRISQPVLLIPLNLDPPASLPYRHLLMPYFSPKAVAGLEAKIRRWAIQFIDAVADHGQCEFVEEISSRFPVSVFMEMMGIPFDRFETFRAAADEFFKDIPEARRHELVRTVVADFTELWEARKRQPQEDLISVLAHASIENRPLRLEEYQSMAFLLFLAGLDTVVNLLTFGYQALAMDPALQQRLVAEPASIPGFVEECLRLFGVVNSPRLVVQDYERFGIPFRAGDMVVCLNPTFGRDARENPQPLVIDVDRPARKLLPFSTGPHLCLGHHLARSEIRIFTEEWLKRIPAFKVSGNFKPAFRAGMVMAMRSLPLQFL
jgi:cytochrome P450